MSIPWQPGTVIPMDPEAVLDYTMDCALWLDGGVLDSASVVYDGCIVIGQPVIEGTKVTIRVGNVFGKPAVVTLTITAADGQRDKIVYRFTSRKG